jgi:plastocyanin
MKVLNSLYSRFALWALVILAVLAAPQVLPAQHNWKAAVGAQNTDKGHQALAFLPNEFWIHSGDSITWTSESDEIHTVTFLTAKQIFPAFQVGCPGFILPVTTFNGSTCVTSPPLNKGQSLTVHFPKAGNYKLVCLVHNTMNGTVHVLHPSEVLPHDQDFYDVKGAEERHALLSDIESHMKMEADPDHDGDDDSVRVIHGNKHVTAGVGEIVATPGGLQTGSLNRFLKGTIHIEAGDTVEWSNHDPEEPHTITFGTEPANPFPPSANVTVDSDGARHAILTGPGDSVHSGFIEATLVDDPGLLPQNPLDVTRFRVTFKQPGTYKYICALHDNLGMVGTVVVEP